MTNVHSSPDSFAGHFVSHYIFQALLSPTSYKYERDSGLIEDASVFGTPGVKEVLKGDRGEGTYSSISEPISESLSIALSSTLSDMLSDPKILPAEIGGLLVRNC